MSPLNIPLGMPKSGRKAAAAPEQVGGGRTAPQQRMKDGESRKVTLEASDKKGQMALNSGKSDGNPKRFICQM